MENVWGSIQDGWNGLLDLSTKLVTPDWSSLIALLPIGVLLAVILVFAWLTVQRLNVGPTHRGPGRVPPRAPADIHMPGPSFAPVFAAFGAFLFFFGLVIGVGKPAFWLGLGALILTLLYWLREGMRDYDRIDAPHGAETLPAVVHAGPPEGVHMPGPSFRPILVSIAAAILFAGLVVGPALLVGGIVLLFISLVGWLGDAGHEYHAVAASDLSGHLEPARAPHYPIGTLVAFVVVLVVGIGISAGIVPGTSGEAAASKAPGSGAASAGPGASGGMPNPAASAAPGAAADVSITAENIQFTTTDATAPAGKAFTIAFSNQDAGVPHDVAIHKDSPTGPVVFQGQIVTGPTTVVYDVPAIPAGTYAFVCTVHPNMTGTLTVK